MTLELRDKIGLWDVASFWLGVLGAPWVAAVLPWGDDLELLMMIGAALGVLARSIVRRTIPWTTASAPLWPRLAVVAPLVLTALVAGTIADFKLYTAITEKLEPDSPAMQIVVSDSGSLCNSERKGERTCVAAGAKVKGRRCYSAEEWDRLQAEMPATRAACAEDDRRAQAEFARQRADDFAAQVKVHRVERDRALHTALALGASAILLLLIGAAIDWRWRRRHQQPR